MCVVPIGWFAVSFTCYLVACHLKPEWLWSKPVWKNDCVKHSLSTPKVRILPQKRASLLHRKSNVHSSVDVPPDGGMLQHDHKLESYGPWHLHTGSPDLRKRCQAMLKRHGCRAISVPLGAYGALSEWLFRTEGCSEKKIIRGQYGVFSWSRKVPVSSSCRKPLQIGWPLVTFIAIYLSTWKPGEHSRCSFSYPDKYGSAWPRKRVTLYTTAPYLLDLGTSIDPCQRPY